MCLTILLVYSLTGDSLLSPVGHASAEETSGEPLPPPATTASTIFAASPYGEAILPLYYDEVRQEMWGTQAPASNRLYKSSDKGITWQLVYQLPFRTQTPTTNYWVDKVYGIQVLPTGTILVSAVNSAWNHNGTIYRSTDGGRTFQRALYANGIGFPDGTDFEYVRGVSYPWAFDHNGQYALAGTYSYRDPEGKTDRDVWMSADDGATWNRVFHVEGDSSVHAMNIHSHMARIDPDGGAWISFGDHMPGWSHDNLVLGLWHSPGPPAPISGEPTTHDFGSFTRVYSHSAANNWARIRPVTVLFRHLPTGEKYAYLGEDDMTFNEGRTITRMRYDDGSYATEVKANYTAPFGNPSPNYNGGIFGMTRISDTYWVAAATAATGTNPVSTWALLYTTDGGETWQRDEQSWTNVHHILPATVGGRVWGGRPPGDTWGPGYRPPTRPDFTAAPLSISEGSAVSFADATATPAPAELSWRWKFGDGEEAVTSNPGHVYADDGVYTATLTVTDSSGTAARRKENLITVVNAAPTVATSTPLTIYEGEELTPHFSFTDAGVNDTHQARIDWGDGTVTENAHVDRAAGSGTITGIHAYSNSGFFQITVTVTDDDGGSASSTTTASVSCTGEKPQLAITGFTPLWESYSDYADGLLTVDYRLANRSRAGARDITVMASHNTNGVELAEPTPHRALDHLRGQSEAVMKLKYAVPGGVSAFQTTTYVAVSDSCGNSFYYPGPSASP